MLKTFSVTEKYEDIIPFLESKKNQSSYLCELIQKEMNNERTQLSVEKLHDDFLKSAHIVIREELQAELRDELRPEIKAEIKGEIRSELRGEFRDFRQQIVKDILQEVTQELRNYLSTFKNKEGSEGIPNHPEKASFVIENGKPRKVNLNNLADPFK